MHDHSFYPNFLGIGAQKSGTTWLAAVLSSHPKIYIPRKEIHFFDRHYDLGWHWYEKQFSGRSNDQILTGEFTPEYMYYDQAAGQIIQHLPATQLICMLRDPVDRAHSQYRMAVHKAGFQATFADFLKQNPDAVDRGFYHRQLMRFQTHRRNGLLHVHIFERAIKRPDEFLAALAGYLGIDVDGFALPEESDARIGAAKEPRFPALRKNVTSIGKYLRYRNMHQISDALIKYAMPTVRMLLEKGNLNSSISEEDWKKMADIYKKDILDLEEFLEIDLSIWPSYPK